ncbi:helix-turn-helix domain-containing protein [Nocardia arthritidis]|uniref:Transcriptional regulator n=1 Tax=Nocardia arthritidis TaxID=228602 RepID=A0A6G9Y6I5_9NOCA|nr:helix-turn-helix transcriptional regulator [Nocardia arthritidis]QIS08821.1 transcriptional regulator [Nocardia arthritidis]
MAPTSPTVARWELTLRLNEWRKQLGIDVDTAAKALKITRNHWWQIMSDRRALTDDHFEAMMKLFGIGADEQRELRALRNEARERGWWSEYSGLFSDENRRLFGLEHGAQAVQSYEGLLIPGLLQTENYARAIMESDIARIRPVDAERYIEARMRRQKRLIGDDRLQLTAVISQAALVQQTGGSAVLREQLAHLVEMVRNKDASVDVRIVPFSATRRPILSGSPFHLIDFASSVLPTLAWHESVATHGIIDDPARVRELRIIYAQQFESALSQSDSLALIEQTADGIA